MSLSISIGPLVSLIAGILILVMPRLLSTIVALYLIIMGFFGPDGHGFHAPLSTLRCRCAGCCSAHTQGKAGDWPARPNACQRRRTFDGVPPRRLGVDAETTLPGHCVLVPVAQALMPGALAGTSRLAGPP